MKISEKFYRKISGQTDEYSPTKKIKQFHTETNLPFSSWVNTHPFDILTWNFRKYLFRENFSKILRKPRLSSTKTCEISPYFLPLLFCIRIALKKFTQVLSYVV